MRGYLYGILSAALAVLVLIVLYAGLISLIISPDERIKAGAFVIERGGPYLETKAGWLTPTVISSTDTITYTFVISK